MDLNVSNSSLDVAAVEPQAQQDPDVASFVQNTAPHVFDFEDARSFVLSPAPMGQTLYCHIERRDIPSGVYHMFIENPTGEVRKFLMSSKKVVSGKSANYAISINRDDPSDTKSHVARLRSNFMGTNFMAVEVGPGDPPGAKTFDAGQPELVTVLYAPNILGIKGPRKMTALMPGMAPDGHRLQLRPQDESESMLHRFKSGTDGGDLIPLGNKPPFWNEAMQSFTLDFRGRVTLASVKNFQLVHEDDVEYVVLQMGKVADHVFTIDLQYPMAPAQAFAIALSSFHSKLACE